MLKTRVLTAIAVLPVVLGMLFAAGDVAWALFAGAIALVACWEWSRLCGFRRGAQLAYLGACGAIAAALLAAYLRAPGRVFANLAEASFIAAAYFWVFAVPVWLALRLRAQPWAAGVAGWVVVWPTWAALVVLREASPWILLAAAALVWVADIAAYFAGRRFGRRKLAPAISPGKTWEGAVGGGVMVLIYGFFLSSKLPVALSGNLALLLVILVVLTAISILGDLFESLLKRQAGLKDSSNVLPGHGGVLDRIDSLTSTLPLVALVWLLTLR